MKRILKLFSVIAVLLLMFGLCSCGEDASVPDGMQLVKGGVEHGYNFYAPEEWVVASYGEFACAYVSAVNNTSVTFAEAKMPEYGKDGMDENEVRSYFDEHMNNLSYMKERKVTVRGEQCSFGNEQNAYRFVYTYDYPKENGAVIHYRAMQILIVRSGRLYIFQYNSQNAVPTYATDSKTYYDVYLEKVNEIIQAFRFLDKPAPEKEDIAGSSGDFVLVSDPKICGFSFYAPSDSTAVASSALIHRNLGGGASVSISELVSNDQVTHPDEYWKGLKSNMSKSFGEITDINTLPKDENKRDIKGAVLAYYYEYQYSYAGVEYRGYVLILQTGTNALNAKAYIFNYTAKADAYDESLLNKMLDKVEFK